MLDYLRLLTRYTSATQCQQENCNGIVTTGDGLAEFAELLRDARLAKAKRDGRDVRPADVARAMGITRSAYGHWESGRSLPKDMVTLERLAVYLGVRIDRLGVDLRALPLTRADTRARRGKRVTTKRGAVKEG